VSEAREEEDVDERDADALEEALERALAGELAAGSDAPAGSCPPAESLAARAEGRLLPELEPALERHLVTCASCREAAAFVGLAVQEAREVTSRAHASIARRLLLVATLLVAVASLLFLLLRDRGGATDPAAPPPGPLEPEERLRAVVTAFSRERPDLFEGFTLIDDETLSAVRPPVLRGGMPLVAPREVVLRGRPTFRWRAVPGAEEQRVRLLGADGEVRFERDVDGAGLEFPSEAQALPEGSEWMWTVSARTAEGPRKGSLAFRVATREEADRWRQALAVVEARVARDEALLIGVHLALRRGLVEEAERLLAGDADSVRGSPALQRLAAHVRARLGLD
jgi:hypothetical protein